ncbi:MAG: inorganic phosphate transporter [Myxococcota bacterium]
MEPTTILLLATVACGLYLAWSIGANDAANSIGTAVGSGALRMGQAVAVAGCCEFAGAVLVGDAVAGTIQHGIVDPAQFTYAPHQFAQGMLTALLATAIWLQMSSRRGIPVSTTHSIVGAVCGFAWAALGSSSAVHWEAIARIVGSWFISPLLGCSLSLLLFLFVRHFILRAERPTQALAKHVPTLVWALFFLPLLIVLDKTLRPEITRPQATLLACGLAAVAAVGVKLLLHHTLRHAKLPAFAGETVERVFARLQWLTVSLLAFAHGSNDVANAIGPMAAVVHVAQTDQIVASTPIPFWLLALGGAGIVLGLATYGTRVVATIGGSITEITPTRGFCAELATALTTLLGSRLGLPLSSTQVLVGAVIGVGLARGVAGLNRRVISRIMTSWLISVPAAALLSAGLFLIWQAIVMLAGI